jgi:hypothetical protein
LPRRALYNFLEVVPIRYVAAPRPSRDGQGHHRQVAKQIIAIGDVGFAEKAKTTAIGSKAKAAGVFSSNRLSTTTNLGAPGRI